MTVDPHGQPMQTPTPHWSQTSTRLMNACPRAWAITYGTTDGAPKPRRKPTWTPPRTFDQLLIRTMRTTWLRRLDDQYKRKIWSFPYAKRAIGVAVDDAMDLVNMAVPQVHLEMGKQRSNKQLRTLEQCQTLRPLFTGQPRRWAYFDRRDAAMIGGVEVYAAPDVAIFHQHRWTLVRIQFRSLRRPLLGQQLEHLLMIHWAINQPGFPQDVEAYNVKVVGWDGRRWREHSVNVSEELLEQSIALVRHDVQEMQWLKRWASADPSFGSLPLAAHHEQCRTCSHRPDCPARDGLAQAKQRQEKSFLSHHHNEATKSARTA